MDEEKVVQKLTRVRFETAPRGALHLVDARVALINVLFVDKMKGQFILRIEDSDSEKVTSETIAALLDDLKWLQISWHERPDLQKESSNQPHSGGEGEAPSALRQEGPPEAGQPLAEATRVPLEGVAGPYRQSLRKELYQQHLERLLEEGKAYPCYCSVEKLDEERRRFFAQGKPAKYTGTCRLLSSEEKAGYEQQGLKPLIRLKVDRQIIKFHDEVFGDQSIDSDTIGDWVLQGRNGQPTYDFACVVDDYLMQISHVIRGHEHFVNTTRQILLYQSLGWSPPCFAHIPLILGEDHTLLSKKQEGITIGALRDQGYLAPAVINYLCLLGWTTPERREILTWQEIVQRFSLERLGRTSPTFEWEKLDGFNAYYLKELSPPRFFELCKKFVPDYEEAFNQKGQAWLESTLLLLQRQCRTFREIAEYLTFFIRAPEEIGEEAKKALSLKDAPRILKISLEEITRLENVNLETMHHAIETIKEKAKSKSKNLYVPLRVALTGQIHGPELPLVASLLGKEECLRRIDYAIKNLQHPPLPERTL